MSARALLWAVSGPGRLGSGRRCDKDSGSDNGWGCAEDSEFVVGRAEKKRDYGCNFTFEFGRFCGPHIIADYGEESHRYLIQSA